MGADAVVLAGHSVDPYNGKCLRASAGSIFAMPVVVRNRRRRSGFRASRDAGLQVLATTRGRRDQPRRRRPAPRPTAWLFGPESHGLPAELAALADHRVRIPMAGGAESLNVAAAAAICLYQSARALPKIWGVPMNLTVSELVDMFRTFYPYPLPRDDVIGLAGLSDKARSQAGTLSGGQRQRLYFALAVCGDPEALFLDEPTVGMDVASRNAFLESIAEYGRRGRTIILTTHLMDEADELVDRIVVIARGRIIADDTPARIKSRVVGKRVRFRTTVPLEAQDLTGLPVTALSVSDRRVSFLSATPEMVLADLFRRGVAIDELEVGGADLEEAFLALTGADEPVPAPASDPQLPPASTAEVAR